MARIDSDAEFEANAAALTKDEVQLIAYVFGFGSQWRDMFACALEAEMWGTARKRRAS